MRLCSLKFWVFSWLSCLSKPMEEGIWKVERARIKLVSPGTFGGQKTTFLLFFTIRTLAFLTTHLIIGSL